MKSKKLYLALTLIFGVCSVAFSQQSSLYVSGPSELTNQGARTLMLNGDDADSWLTFHDYNNDWFSVGMDYSDGRKFKINRGGSLGDYNQFTMTLDGKIGIGTASPTGQFEVSSSFVTNTGQIYIKPQDASSEGGEVVLMGTNAYPVNWSFDNLAGDIRFHHSGAEYLRIKSNGNVGIGTSSPNQKLNVFDGNISLKVASNSDTQGVLFQNSGSSYVWAIQRSGVSSADLLFKGGSSSDPSALASRVVFKNNGDVGIGTSNPDSKLTVKGIIHAEEVKLDLTVPGPDYVFEESYPLLSLEETNAYIRENKHLPGIPSSDEMQQNGVNLLEMNMRLLEKVEELTLYLIALKLENDQIKQRIHTIETKIE